MLATTLYGGIALIAPAQAARHHPTIGALQDRATEQNRPCIIGYVLAARPVPRCA